MFQRWLYVPAVLLTAFLYDWLHPPAVLAVICLLITANIVARYFYRREISFRSQMLLSLALLSIDIAAAFWMITLSISHGHTVAYVIFMPMIVEAAIRFGLKGSLIADIIFALVFFGIRQYGIAFWNVSYPPADYVLTVGVMSFVSLMVGMVAREWRHHRRHVEQLAAEHASLLERRRISNELHDSVLKSLEGLALEAHALSKQQGPDIASPPSEQSRYIENVCRQISREIRDVIFEMRAETAPQNIIQRINESVERWRQENGPQIMFSHCGDIPDLPWRLSHNIQKVLDEALTNIRRHARATQVKITLDTDGHSLKTSVEDNGCGFNADLHDIYAFTRQGRLGLITMKERIEMIGGSFNIESGVSGTTITAHIPIPSSAKQEYGKS